MKVTIRKDRMLPHQREFWECRKFLNLLVGGYGCGKTHIGALRVIWLSYLNRPYPVLYVSPTYPQARRTIIFTLETLLSEAGVRYSYNKSYHEIRIPGWGGLIWIASGEIPNSLKGPNVAAAGIDEPFIQKRETFEVILSRVRENKAPHNEIFLTGTPEQLNWGYEVAMNDEGRFDIQVTYGRTEDNTHLSAQFISMLRSAYDENQVAAYMNGMFVNLTKGRVYRYFERTEHVRAAESLRPGPEEAVQAGIDFNVEYMTAELFVRRGDRLHFFEEIRLADADTYLLADLLHGKYPGITLYPDASGSSRRTSARKSDHTILRDRGFRVLAPKANPAVKDRVNAVNNLQRTGRLTVGDCPHLVKDLERVVWKRGELDKHSDPKLTHASDAAGYAVSYLFPVRIERPYEQPTVWRV
ncbi:phage terminase large subunit [Chlorobium sp. N1]|uniref:phage terminase large subunit n=1 Tax=Chlorobium sp. N1 TaxID=2491138 RepID=UPI00103FA645|nr:phage terminase large subunit [Chlorobium sp. N1]TCD47012.1 hypothetical protein E0L29_10275 [Chlorobium sp. N1]